MDADVLAELRTALEDDKLIVDLVGIFVEDTPPRLEQLHLAAARGDNETASSVAHALKGSAATFGAAEFVRLCGEIEEAAGASVGEAEGHGIEGLAHRVSAEYEQVVGALQAYADRLRP